MLLLWFYFLLSLYSFCSATLISLLFLKSLNILPPLYLCHLLVPLLRSFFPSMLIPHLSSLLIYHLSERPFLTTLCTVTSPFHVTFPFIYLYSIYHYLIWQIIYIYTHTYIHICIYILYCCLFPPLELEQDLVHCCVFSI